MAQKGIIRNTVEASKIDASDFASIFNSIIGDTSGIIDYRSNLNATIVDNNTVRLDDGLFSLLGHILYIEEGTSIDLNIESGTLGMNRIDAIVATYKKNGVESGTDTLEFEVVRGTPVSGTPTIPQLEKGDINGTAILHQELVFTVEIKATTITKVTCETSVFKNIKEMNEELEYLMMMDVGGELNEAP